MSNPAEKILGRLDRESVRPVGEGKHEARCPCHDDNHASLSVSEGEDGRILIHCHAGCSTPDILRTIGLEMKDLYPESSNGHASNGHAQKGKAKAKKKLGKIVAEHIYTDESGGLLFQNLRYDPKDFRQRAPDGKGGWVWSVKNVRVVPYRLHQLVNRPGEVVFLVEGEKDVDALEHRGLLATTNAGGASKGKPKFTKKHAEFLRGRRVVIIPDNDEPGLAHAENAARLLHGVAASVKILALSDLPDKGDASDWLAAGGTAEQLVAMAEAAPLYESKASGRAGIIIGIDEERMTDETVAALARLGGIYQRGGCLVQIVESAPKGRGIERPKGAPIIAPIMLPTLRDKISTAATFLKHDAESDEYAPVRVPDTVVRAVHARGFWAGIPAIEAVVEVPILRADGSVLESPGFDPATGIYFFRGDGVFPPVPERPTLADAKAAAEMLLDVVCDFPFAGEASKAAYLAMQLSPFARFAYHGHTPFGLIEGNAPGCGKGLLAEVMVTPWSGIGIASTACPQDDAEFNKMITSLVIGGEMLVRLDNVRGPLGGPALEAALTSTTWSGRVLGQSRMTGTMPMNLIWLATANNATLVGDLPRRVLNIRLESPLEQPEEREGFKYPDLVRHVRDHRGDLAVACCTILKAYHVAGRPNQKLPSWGSFAEWSARVRSAVVWCGLADPADTRIELRDRADTEAQALRQLIAGWQELDPEGDGLSVTAAIKRLDEYPDRFAAAREAMGELFGHGKAKPASTKTIGRRLAGFRRRVVGGKRFESKSNRVGVQLWFVEGAGLAGFAGCSNIPTQGKVGDIPTHAHAPVKGSGALPANHANPATSNARPCDHDWVDEVKGDRIRTSCRTCGKFRGYRPAERVEAEF